MFRGTCLVNVSGQNVLKPLPKKYAVKFRLVRLLILVAWVIGEGCLGFYNKIAKCRSSVNVTDPNNFDLFDNYLTQEEQGPKASGLCSTHGSYSTHFFGFITGLLLGLVVLKGRRLLSFAIKVTFKVSVLIVFMLMVFFLVYRNHEMALANNDYRGISQYNCTLDDYEKLCQAKCYCGWNQTLLNNQTFFDNCHEFTICNWRQTQKGLYESICRGL